MNEELQASFEKILSRTGWLNGMAVVDKEGTRWRKLPYAWVSESDHCTRTTKRMVQKGGCSPDFSDAATMGCIMALMKELQPKDEEE
tara:strand:+ start:2015 stop:2275 length:261 start_codon:yes stop_codon:yes gene_type:complete